SYRAPVCLDMSLASHSSYTSSPSFLPLFFFSNAPPPTDIYTLSLHDALPIWFAYSSVNQRLPSGPEVMPCRYAAAPAGTANSLRSEEHTLNSSHQIISYAVFCLKKKK